MDKDGGDIIWGSVVIMLVFFLAGAVIVNTIVRAISPATSTRKNNNPKPLVEKTTSLPINPTNAVDENEEEASVEEEKEETDNNNNNWRCACEGGFLPPGMLQSFGGAEAAMRMGMGQCYHKTN